MKSLGVDKVMKDFERDPSGIIAMIVENNPDAVAHRIRTLYGLNVISEPSDINEQISEMLVGKTYQEAAEILNAILSVDIKDYYLNDVTQGVVLEYLGKYDLQKRTGMLKNGILLPDYGDQGTGDVDITDGGTAQGDASAPEDPANSFNWGAVLATTLPAILGYFGIQGNQNSGGGGSSSGTNNNNNSSASTGMPSWIWILLIVVLLSIVAYVAFRKQ